VARRNDVVLARAFFSDSPESKVRPFIVLSDERYSADGYAILAPITTAGDEHCIPISKGDADCAFVDGSGVRCDSIYRVRERQIIRKLGRVNREFYSLLSERICALIR